MSLWVDQKYVALVAPRLNKFKKKSDTIWNFRCPYCGDSQKDKNKTRGYLYTHKDRVSFKCHNCNESSSLQSFLTFIDPSLGNAYRLENFANQSNTYTKVEKKVEKPALSQEIFKSIGVVPITGFDPDTRVMQYVRSRKIPEQFYSDLYYTHNMQDFTKINKDYTGRLVAEERLVIPYRDRYGNLTGVTCRALGNNKKRYINVRFSDKPQVYGWDKLDASKQIFITEGAFDSMFVDNAIAVGGSDMARVASMFLRQNVVLVFDNEPRNKQIIEIMEKMIAQGYAMVIWPKTWKAKDINQAIVSGLDKDEVQRVIYNNTHAGLSLKLAIRDWKKI